MDLHQRSILLTGAGGGIGASLALRLAERAACLTLVGRHEAPLEEVAAAVRAVGGEAQVVPADLTDPGAPARVVQAAVDRFGRLDVVVNNAGNVRAGRLEQISEEEVLAQVALNVTAPILVTRAALGPLRASGDGLVVNVSSAIALVGMPFYTVYAATKAGVAHLGEALRRELHGEGVGVLTVYPGATRTAMMETSKAGPEHGFDYESPDAVAQAVLEAMIDGRLGVIRGGETRSRMIAMNRDDPAAVDRMLAERKDALEEAVAGHSSL
jgi:short-subunit dehydrogenase